MSENLIFSIFADIVVSVISVYLLITFMNIFLRRNRCNALNIMTWTMWFLWQIVISRFNIFSDTANVLITALMTMFVCIFTYKGKVLLKIVFSAFFNAIWMLIEILCSYFFTFINIDYGIVQFLVSITSKLLFLAFILGLKQVFFDEDIKKLPNYYSMFLIIITCGSVFVVNNTFSMNNISTSHSLRNTVSAVIVSIIMLFSNIVFFTVCMRLASQLELKKCNTLYEQYLSMYEHNLLLSDIELLEYRKERHNLKNQLISIIEYAKNEEFDKIINFANDQILDKAVTYQKIAKTENCIIDTVINYKYSIAVQKSIKFVADLQIPTQLPYNSSDLCIILGNALDNALEAVEKQNIDDKYIKIKIRYDKDNLKICIKNTFNGYLLKDKEGNLKTIKEDAQNHGFGLYSIMKAASKYQGTAKFSNNESEFCLRVLLYNPERTTKTLNLIA